MIQWLSFKQCAESIAALGHKRSYLVLGENGIGKTSIQSHLRQLPQFADYYVPNPINCPELSDGSLWMPDINRDKGVSRELPNERMGISATNNASIEGSTPSVLCFDEVTKARQYIKDQIAPIIHERRNGIFNYPPESRIWATGNLTHEGLGDSMLAHLRTRFIVLHMRKSTQQEYKVWAVANNLHPVLLTAIDHHPEWFDSFMDYDKGGKYEGKDMTKEAPAIFNPRIKQDGYVSLRTLHMASDVLWAADAFDTHTLLANLIGAVGSVGAAQLMAIYNLKVDVPVFERVVADPDNTPLVSNPLAQLLQVNQFISRTKQRHEAAAVTKYAKRMQAELQCMFVNRIVNIDSAAALFCTVDAFRDMQNNNRLFLNVA